MVQLKKGIMHFEQANPSDETGKPLTKKWSLATN